MSTKDSTKKDAAAAANTMNNNSVQGTAMSTTEVKTEENKAKETAGKLLNLSATLGSMCVPVSNMTAEGRLYIDRLVSIVNDTNKVTITAKAAVCPYAEGRLIMDKDEKYAILIVFADTYKGAADRPVVDAAHFLLQQARNEYPVLSILQSIVVIPEEYSLVANMAQHITNSINLVRNKEDILLSHLRDQCHYNGGFRLCRDMNKILNFITMNSPHAVPARAEWGVALEIKNPNIQRSANPNVDEYVIITAAVGYTNIITNKEFLKECTYIAMPTITDIVSITPSRRLAILAIDAVGLAIVAQRGWIDYFKHQLDGRLPNNIGMLDFSHAAEGKMSPALTVAEVEQICYAMADNNLALDISDGRARTVGIDAYGIDSSADDGLLTDIMEMTGTQLDPSIAYKQDRYGIYKWFTHDGYYRDGGQLFDTRYIDYLPLTTKVDIEVIKPLLIRTVQENTKYNKALEIFPEANVKLLYNTKTVMLTMQTLRFISDQLRANGITYYNPSTMSYELPLYDKFAQNPVLTQYPMTNQQNNVYDNATLYHIG